jgi:hypothetical protein
MQSVAAFVRMIPAQFRIDHSVGTKPSELLER